MTEFQSTRPRGARPANNRQDRAAAQCFNPRAREGRDDRALSELEQFGAVSIHAPARGATD